MNRYLIGAAVIGGDVTSIPKAGITYTDEPTVRAVQTALKDKGFDPGTIDGIYGPKTQRAIKAMQSAAGTAQTGVIDYSVLMALGISAPSGGSVPVSSPAPTASGDFGGYAQVLHPTATTQTAAPTSPPGWLMQPLWDGAPVKRWQGIFGAAAGLLAAAGIISAVRR